MFMAKKATNSNEFVNKMRTAKCVSENIIVPTKQGWDYSLILLVGGVLKLAEAGSFYDRHEAGQFSAWLAEETLKRIYRFKYSKAMDDIHCYIRNFVADHQFGKLKRWIYDRLYGKEDYLLVKTRLLGDYQD